MTDTGAIQWLAGFLEGEGYFTFANTRGLLIGADSTDEDVVRKAHSIMSGSSIYGPYTNGVGKSGRPNKVKWRVQVNGKHAASWGMTVYPLMCSRRQEAIRKGLEIWRQRPVYRGDRLECSNGHLFDYENTYTTKKGERQCRTCNRERMANVRARESSNKPIGMVPMSGKPTLDTELLMV